MPCYYRFPIKDNLAIGLIDKRKRPESASARSDFRANNGAQLAARAKKIKVTLPVLDWGDSKEK